LALPLASAGKVVWMTSMHVPKFTLEVLGGFRLYRSGAPVELPTRKLACLLTYLACVAPQPQSRERLADLLWGANNDARARYNLRQALSRLRQLLGPDAIMNVGETVLLARDVVACDAVSFDALLRENTETSIPAAIELYAGAFLEDVAVSEMAWNDWLLRERDRLRERAIGAIVAHGERALAAGDAESAMRCGRRAIAFDNLREDAHRLVLKGLSAAGRNSEALRHYQDLAAFLKAELNAAPDEETSLLAAALGQGRASAGSSASGRIGRLPALRPGALPQGTLHDQDGALVAEAVPGEPPNSAALPQGNMRLDRAERRQVTILVCNAVTASSHPASVDPEDMRDCLSSFRRVAAELVASFGGCIAASLGNSVQACFGYPETREQDAVQAARAGLAIVQAMQLQGGGAASGPVLQASIGIATGLVVIEEGPGPDGREHPVVIGEASTLALQLQALAAPGQIIVSRETRLLLDLTFEFLPIDALTPGGTTGRLEAWLVDGERREARSPDAGNGAMLPPLVGRQEEFELLRRRWDQAKRGQGRVVLLSGEPGIGKSCIAEHLLAELAEDKPARLRYFCSPHHALRPLHPYIRQLENSAGLSSAGSPAERLDRFAALIKTTSSNVMRDVALMGELLMLPLDERYPALEGSPQQKRELVMTAYAEILAGLATQRPVVVLFEDIHWIDPTSLDLLDRTVTQIAHLPVLLIATCRPEHRPAWVGQPHVTLLHLNRLGRRDSAAIISEVACDKPFPQPIVDQIIDRADGVPLFVKELSRHMLESGLSNETADSNALKGMLPPFSIPTKLRAVLGVRLERLGTARRLALIGAVIGRRFSRALIAAILDPEFADLDEALDRLTASGLMSRRGTPPDDSYIFTHALVHDAAYDMLLKDERRRLHSQVANILIDRFSAQADGSPEIVAHHLSQAGRAGEAAEYWATAARLAHARWANRESADFFDLALGAIDELPRTPATLQSAVDVRFEIKNALTPLGEFDRIVGHLRAARTLIAQLDDPQRLCRFNLHMSQVLGLSGKSHEAIEFGQEAEILARSFNDPQLLIEATVFLATAYFTIMDYRQAERLFLTVLELLDGEPGGKRFALAGFPGITAGAYLTRINAVRGEFEQGIRYGETAVRQAEALAQPYGLSIAMWCLADLHLTRGDIAPAVELLERGLALSRQWDLPFLSAGHSGSLGYAYALVDRADEGLPLLEQAMTVFEKMRHEFALSLFLVPLGEAYVMAGRFDQAVSLARRALKLAQESGHRSCETGSLYILADVAARTDLLEEAELQYRDALAVAEDLGMRPLAARCRHGLANVRALGPEPEKARIDLATATMMYRDMGMGFWLRQLETSM
jgi:DNA-binding SARP family transcriptional activator/class 3 adenylate cyclase